MKKIYFLIFIYMIFGKNFDGYILDQESGNPIENVELILSSNNELITTSKTDGYFIINTDNFRTDSLFLNHIGYVNRTILISDLSNKIYLKKDALYGDVIEVTSSRKEKRISDSPVLTQIISGEDLNNTPALNFYQSLHMLFPSINFSPDNHGTNISIQGLSSEYILILVDGNRISGNTAGNIDFSQFNTENIERVEILKGSASTLYGSNAIGGVINIITKPIKDNTTSITSNMSYGSFNKKNNYISINTHYNKISSRTDFKFKQSDGYKITQNRSIREQNEFNDYSMNQHLKYKKEDLEIELNGNYYNHNWYRRSYYDLESNALEREDDRRNYESYSIGLKEKNHFTKINGHYNFSYNVDYYKKYYVIDMDYTTNSDDISYEWTNSKTEQISSLLYLFKNKYNITLGLDWINEKGESKDVEHEGAIIKESEFGSMSSKIFRTTSFFVQSQYELTQKINLFFGTRYTNHSKFDDRVTSDFTIKYNIASHTFRLNLSQGYKMPDIYELYYDWMHPGEAGIGFMVIGNPNLEPEDSFNINLSYQKLNKNWNFMALLSRNYISDMISEYLEDKNDDGIEDYHYQNYNQVSINSIELSINGNFKNINLSTSYNFIRKIDELEEERLPNLSDHTLTINSDIKLKNQLYLFINFNYYSQKTNESVTENSTIQIPAYHQTNISIVKNGLIDYGLFKKMNLKLGVNNVFNYTNFKDVTFQSPGRTFVIEGTFNYDFK